MRPSRRVPGRLDFYKRPTSRPTLPRLVLRTPPNGPVSRPRPGKLDPAWARVGRIPQFARHPTAAALLRPFTSETASVRCSPRTACEGQRLGVPVPQGPSGCNPLCSSTAHALFLASLIAAALAVYSVTSGTSADALAVEDTFRAPHEREVDDEMEALPGRPGNLTPEEEEKLRRFWDMFLHVCGVYEDGAEGEQTSLAEQGKTATAGSDKPKKKHLNPFKKRKDKGKENKNPDKDAAELPAKHDDPEDKWGETKAYHETLAKHPPEEIRATIWSMVKHDNPDALLLRFLRARKWDLQRALVMMVSTMNWRASEMRVDSDVMMNGEEYALINEKSTDEASKKEGEDFLAQMRIGKSYCYGIDKAGRPICVCRARFHKAGEQSETSLERYTVYLIETTRFLLSPPVDTACVVFDLTGFSLANMDYTPVKFMIRCFEANYPESLGVVLVHKAPWVFQGIWRIIRGWLDPVVASKVHFTNNVKDLEEFIDKDKIPDEIDGSSGWTYKYIEPVTGENNKMKDTETRDRLLQERDVLYEEFEHKTLEWIHEDDAAKRMTIKSERSAIAQKLREQYWRLDPYIRSRTLYDRIGVIKPDGKLDYYPTWEAVATTNGAPAATAAVETSPDDLD